MGGGRDDIASKRARKNREREREPGEGGEWKETRRAMERCEENKGKGKKYTRKAVKRENGMYNVEKMLELRKEGKGWEAKEKTRRRVKRNKAIIRKYKGSKVIKKAGKVRKKG